MKMKAVCEKTGLTDRAARYYIEEGLIDPKYTENYIGRRAYDFSEEDVAVLKDIIVLRKYGFSVAEIRQMQTAPDSILVIVEALRDRKRETIAEEKALLDVLLAADIEKSFCIRDLSTALSDAAEQFSVPQEDAMTEEEARGIWFFCRLCPMLLAVAELLGCAALIWKDCMHYHYPKGSPLALFLMVLFLIPAVLTLSLPLLHFKNGNKRRLRRIAAILCVLFLLPSLFCSLGIVTRSETSDISAYRRFDPDSLAARSPLLQDLFPLWAPVEGDRQYHYRDLPGFDPTYDVYAEWSLNQEAFEKEIERASSVLEAHPSENYDLLTIQKGSWTCLFCSYKGYAPFTTHGDDPFEPVHSSYDYTIFAYDAARNRVRYLDGYSLEDGYYQPYYLQINWE